MMQLVFPTWEVYWHCYFVLIACLRGAILKVEFVRELIVKLLNCDALGWWSARPAQIVSVC